jgi:DNA replication protein DnaC
MLTLKKAQEKTSEAIFASNEERAAKIKIAYQSLNGRLTEVDFLGVEGSRDESGARTVILREGNCKRCGGQMGYLFPEGKDFMFSCFSCFDHEVQNSKEIANKIYIEKLESPPELDYVAKFKLNTRHSNPSLEAWRFSSYISLVKKWLLDSKERKQKEFLVFVAPQFGGKSYFCAALLNYLSKEKRQGVEFKVVNTLLSELKQEMNKNYQWLLNCNKNADFLILNKLGVHGTNEWALDTLTEILVHRYDHRLPTVITTPITERDSELIFNKHLVGYVYGSQNTTIKSSALKDR